MSDRGENYNGNPLAVPLDRIPLLDYAAFSARVDELMQDEANHCVAYFACPAGGGLRFFCCMADDAHHRVTILSHEWRSAAVPSLEPLTARHPAFHAFEREIHEQYGVLFPGHPWLKPLRRHGLPGTPGNAFAEADPYPFYSIEGGELHEVGVGPVHAGVIEPGYFRFLCNGEKVLHLEIRLGYQHRGIGKLLAGSPSAVRRAVLAENIAGDTAVGHSVAHARLMESLAGSDAGDSLRTERTIALELERLAVHIGDTAALCNDVAYQFGQAVNEALRTLVINTTQYWCGNRLGKGLVRPGGTRYPLTENVSGRILDTLREVGERYGQITEEIFSNPSVLGRFEGIGRVTRAQALRIGAVGMAARSSGLKRDIRWSHPSGPDGDAPFEPELQAEGDVRARAMLRKLEAIKSISVIRDLLKSGIGDAPPVPEGERPFMPLSLGLSMAEGWRGEIVHAAVTDEKGNIAHYRVKDPSFHNWMALALAVRNQEISDFPLCNKSYNLSYCGHDL